MASTMDKAEGAFRTIGEVSEELGVPQHILRYWETRFPQLRPLQRAGNRRYYRPTDVELVRKIAQLLGQEGYTVKGVQKLLAGGEERPAKKVTAVPLTPEVRTQLVRIRDQLRRALAS